MKKFNYQFYGSQVGRMNYGGAIIRRFALFPLMLLMLLLVPTRMVAQTDPAYAEYDGATRTLTFKCGPSKPEEAYELNVGNNIPGWLAKRNNIEKVVFDASFANARPTSCYGWFADCYCLTKIEGIENLNTESVEDMSYMFGNCYSLPSLDLSKLNNTAKVENMAYMFYNCQSLSSLNLSNINTANVKNMEHMFYYCQSLSSLNLSNINTANVEDMAYMFYNCNKLSSLDLTNFNTAKVKNMRSMFWNCSALTTIYVSDKFVTGQVTSSSDMFLYCSNLKGYSDSKTGHKYANCGTDGYFTPGCAYAEYDEGTETLTFKCGLSKPKGAYDLNVGNNTPEWWTNRFNYEDHEEHNKIRKVVFDASFANARPTSCYMWFDRCSDLTEIEGIANLNTEEVTNMGSMFAGCNDLTPLDVSNFNTQNVENMSDMFVSCMALKSLNVSNFDTQKVKDMSNMFYNCYRLTSLDVSNFNTQKVENMSYMFSNFNSLTSLDLSNFDTKEVTNMSSMFWNSSALKTIYVSDKFVTTKVSSGADMFLDCASLKGAITEYSKSKTNHTYANHVDGYFTKLVVRNGDERYGITGETTQLTVDNLALTDNKDFVAYEPFAAKAASYSRTIKTGTTWATLCLPFEVSLANQNFRAFKLLSADDVTETVELEEIETSIAAGTPVIIKMKDGATELKFTEADKKIAKDVQTAETADANYKLQGLYTQKVFSKDADNNCYIVKGDKLMNPAKLLDKTTTAHVGSKPFRAFMVDKSPAPSAGARMFSISVGGSTTAIEQLETTADSKAEYYDLQGRRLQDLQKGINIVKRGGKTMKVIIK